MAKEKAAEIAAPSEGGRKKRGRPMRRIGRRQRENQAKVDRNKQYPVDEGLNLLKEVAGGTKFDQTINVAVHLGIDPRHADQMVRGVISPGC